MLHTEVLSIQVYKILFDTMWKTVRMESNILLSSRYLRMKISFEEIVYTSNKLDLFAGWHLPFHKIIT